VWVVVPRHDPAPLLGPERGEVTKSRTQEVDNAGARSAVNETWFCRYDCTDPYDTLDGAHTALASLESTMSGLQQSGSLFEVSVPEFKALKQCRKELRMLKVSRLLIPREEISRSDFIKSFVPRVLRLRLLN